jgi:hypothetical protein
VQNSARQILLNSLHLEDNSFIVSRGLEELTEDRIRRHTVRELLSINRTLWSSLKGATSQLFCCGEPYATDKLESLLTLLTRNRLMLSFLLGGQDWTNLDVSNTFLSDLSCPASSFISCDFSGSILPYSNLRSVTFQNCNLSRTVLIGAYLEDARIQGSSQTTGLILAMTDRQDGPSTLHSSLADEIADEPLTSFGLEFEHDWQGYWRSTSSDRSNYTANWWVSGHSQSAHLATERTAKLTLHAATINRHESNDGNNGTYRLDGEIVIDRLRSLTVAGGVRILRRGVAAPWVIFWWGSLAFPEGLNPQPAV